MNNKPYKTIMKYINSKKLSKTVDIYILRSDDEGAYGGITENHIPIVAKPKFEFDSYDKNDGMAKENYDKNRDI